MSITCRDITLGNKEWLDCFACDSTLDPQRLPPRCYDLLVCYSDKILPTDSSAWLRPDFVLMNKLHLYCSVLGYRFPATTLTQRGDQCWMLLRSPASTASGSWMKQLLVGTPCFPTSALLNTCWQNRCRDCCGCPLGFYRPCHNSAQVDIPVIIYRSSHFNNSPRSCFGVRNLQAGSPGSWGESQECCVCGPRPFWIPNVSVCL